jgi:hypothetical protein
VATDDQITQHDDFDPDENVWVGERPRVPTSAEAADQVFSERTAGFEPATLTLAR